MGADLTGAYGLPIDPVVASGLSVEDVNLLTQQDWGPDAAESAAIIAAAEAQRAEEKRLRQYEANQANLAAYEAAVAKQNETTFLEDLAQSYVDFYEGDSTTAELLTDPVEFVAGGTADIVTDVLGTDVITGSIEAAGSATAQVLDPITEPLGEELGKYVLPAVIIGGAYLLLK